MSKFKSGDRVIALDDHSSQFTKGKSYRVKESRNGTVMVERDDRGGTTNGWGEHHFELMQEDGPIRIVSRKDFVLGHYGAIHFSGFITSRKEVCLSVRDGWIGIEDLSDAISTLTAIRDALQEQDK